MCVCVLGITEEEKKRTTQLVYHFREGKEVGCLNHKAIIVVVTNVCLSVPASFTH